MCKTTTECQLLSYFCRKTQSWQTTEEELSSTTFALDYVYFSVLWFDIPDYVTWWLDRGWFEGQVSLFPSVRPPVHSPSIYCLSAYPSTQHPPPTYLPNAWVPACLPTFLLTYLPTHSSTHLPTYLPECLTSRLPAYLTTYPPTRLSTYLPTNLPKCLTAWLPAYLLTYLRTHPSIHLPTIYLPTWMPACMAVYLPISLSIYLMNHLYSGKGQVYEG